MDQGSGVRVRSKGLESGSGVRNSLLGSPVFMHVQLKRLRYSTSKGHVT